MGCQTSKSVTPLVQRTEPPRLRVGSALECTLHEPQAGVTKPSLIVSGSTTPMMTPNTVETLRRVQSLTPSVRVYNIRSLTPDITNSVKQPTSHDTQLDTAAPKQRIDKKSQFQIGSYSEERHLDLRFCPIPEVNDESKLQSEQELREVEIDPPKRRSRVIKMKESPRDIGAAFVRSRSMVGKSSPLPLRFTLQGKESPFIQKLASAHSSVGESNLVIPEPIATDQAFSSSKKQKRLSRRKHTEQLDLQPSSPTKKSGFAPKQGGIKSTRLLSGNLQEYPEEKLGFQAQSQRDSICRREGVVQASQKQRELSGFSPVAKKNSKFVFLHTAGRSQGQLGVSSKPSPPVQFQDVGICSSGKASSRSSRQRSTLMHRSPEASACPSLGNMHSMDRASNSTVRISSHRVVRSVRPLLGRFLPPEGGLDILHPPAGAGQPGSQRRESIEAKHLMSIFSPECHDDDASRLISDGGMSSRVASAAKSLQRIALGPSGFLSTRQVQVDKAAAKRETKEIKAFQEGLATLRIADEKKPDPEAPLLKLQRLPMQARVYSYRRNLLDRNMN